MLWHEVLSGAAFRTWLSNLTAGPRIPPGTRLDPFVSSLRRSGGVSTKLERIEAGERPDGDSTQAIADLSQMGLVARNTVGEVEITELGRSVLSQWRSLNIANNSLEAEVARCLILVRLAVALRVDLYIDMYEFWREVRAQYNAENLFRNPHGLYLLSYLNQEIEGFNPWTVIRATRVNVPDHAELDWASLSGAPALADLGQATDELARRITDSANRPMGRLAFCQAMELYSLMYPEARNRVAAWIESGLVSQVMGDITLTCFEETMLSDHEDPELGNIEDLLEQRKNLILYGPPGTGKTRDAFRLAERWERRYGAATVIKTTFHPSYSYEDFIQGFRPNPEDPNTYKLTSGAFLVACDRANELRGHAVIGEVIPKVLLIIDEINRGDTASIFGELITFIESDKRDIKFRLAQNPTKEFSVPSNLFIVGTMNTADRSVSLMDIAFRRRFAFIPYLPEPQKLSEENGWKSNIEDVSLSTLLVAINKRLDNEGIDAERSVGHALLAVSNATSNPLRDLRRRFEVDLIPLISEYCALNRGSIKRILGGLVDEEGRALNLGNDEFLNNLRAITDSIAT